MKQKHFILALVAMLSFAFSAFAQTTVTTEAELRTAMSSAGAITLGGDIELEKAIVIPKKIAIVLDLNGHRIEGVTTGQNGISLEANASLTINDTKGGGLITSKSYVLNGAGGSKIILNAGKIYRSSWAVYTTGSFVINGGSVECNDGSMAIRVAGSGTITLNGGTVTSVQVSGGTLNVQNEDATITSGIQLDKGAKDVNITAGTIEGNITVAPEVTADKITISGGTIEDGDAVKDYLEEGKSLDENGNVVESTVAKIGEVKYTSLQEALDAAVAGKGNVTVTILEDVDLTNVTWKPVTVSAPHYPVVTVEGNNKTITGLTDMLFAGTWAGGSGLIIKDLTIENSTIVNDKDDAKGTVGVGAFIGYPQASATITLENCHLKNSSVEGGHWTGGLIGMAGGYNGTDGPVFMNLTIKGCSVTGSTITGKGSVGGVIGHGSCAAWTSVVIEETTVSDNTITSTGSSNVKAGAVMGTIGAAGQSTTVNGTTKTGGATVSATVADNTVKSNDAEITTIYGRQGTATGMLYLAGGSYDNNPIEENVTYAAPVEGYEIVSNTDGTYGIQEIKIAQIGETSYKTLEAAFTAAKNDDEVEILKAGTYALSTSGKNITITGAVEGVVFDNIGAKNMGSANVTFNNVTFDYYPNVNYTGLQHSGNLEYNNCTINGQVFLYGQSETFNKCTFNQDKADAYNVWTYGAKEVAFNECTFNSAGKSVLVYTESASATNDVDVTKCTFKASGSVDGKAAIEIDTSLSSGANITIDDETTATGFGTGNVSGNSLWNNKKGNEGANNDITIEVGGETVLAPVFAAKIGDVKYEKFDDAIKAIGEGNVVIELLDDVTLDYNARDAYGTATTTSVTIKGNGKTLTLNQKNSDWASIGLANTNGKLVLNDMIIEKTGYGDTSGAWNTHAIIFSCPVEMTGVTINNGIAVQAGATLKNVTINEANGYYGLWVNGNGQTVTMDGGAINATNGGRGIKVADQYIDAPAQVTLNVTGTKFNTAKKAAVLVTSTAGAKITASNVDITDVKEDCQNMVWVDEDRAANYGTVEVTGANVAQETVGSFPIIVKNGDKVVSYFKNLDDLFDNVSAYAKVSNVTVELTGNVVATKVVKTNTFKTYNFVTNVAEGVTMDLQYADNWNYFRKVNIGENVTVKCQYLVFSTETTIAGTVDAYYPYINGGKVTVAKTGTLKYEGGDALQVKGNGAVLTVNGTVIAPTINVWIGNAQLVVSGANAKVQSNWIDIWNGTPSVAITDGATIETNKIKVSRGGEITVTDANLLAAESIEVGHNGNSAGKLTENGESTITGEIKMTATTSTVASDGGLNVTTDIADHKVVFDEENKVYKVVPMDYKVQVGEAKYETIAEAVSAAADEATVTLLADIIMDTKQYVTQNDGYAVLVNVADKDVTIDLNGKIVTVNANATDLDGAKSKMLMAVFHADPNGSLTLTDNSEAKTGKVKVNANDAKIYSFGASESREGTDKTTNGTLTINGGTYIINKVKDSMFFTDADGKIVIDGGNFTLGNIATGENGSPWIFNTYGQNGRQVIVNGGTFNADVNHQFWANEVLVPETKALKDNGDGTWTTVDAVAYTEELATSTYAYSRKVGYASIEEAMAATGKYNCIGNTVALVKNLEVENSIVVPSDVTVVLDLNGKVLSQEKACTASYEMINNKGTLTITDSSEAKSGKISFKDTSAGDPNFGWGSYTVRNEGTLTVENGTIEHLGEQSFATHCIMAIFQYSGSTTINGGTISTPNYRSVRLWKGEMTINGGTFDGQIWAQAVDNTAKLTINGGTFEPNGNDASSVFVTNSQYDVQFAVTNGTFNGKVGCSVASKLSEAISGGTFSEKAKNGTNEELIAAGFTWGNANADGTYNVVVNPEYGKIAQIGNGSVFENQYFATLNDAAQAAKTSDVIKLIADVNISAAGYATVDETDKYSTMMAVKEKDITLDMNGKTITVTPTADELAGAEMQMLMSVFGMDTNGRLTITGNGTVKVVANGANVYSIATAYGEGSQITIENGNFEVDKLMLSGSLLYSQQSNSMIVKGGNFRLGNLADPAGQNGQPWVFNTKGQNYTGAIVTGGTFPTDINHQFWAHEVSVPQEYALKNNDDNIWTVVPSVAYTSEKATSRGSYFRNVGYASIEEAIAATDKYNCEGNVVTLVKDVKIEKMITVAKGTTVVLDLAGKTLAATDNTEKNYSAIDNRGDLTIMDSSEEGSGKMIVTATVDSDWGRYSAVIANNPGGKLTVESGTLEHLGGTDMAYGIDNLTNGKGTYAETEINGGTIKSTYRGIRQFLNGVEAENILTINGGTVEGVNKSIFFHDPSENANTGTLNIDEDAVIKGDIYLFVTENSTAWPVDVYVAKEALEGESTITSKNVPATYHVLEYPAYWTVECDVLEELTIVDGEDAEYINLIQKFVGTLTYERTFDDTEWQTLYLPFEVPVAYLKNEFEVAYIYNASNKNKVLIDYVVIEDETTVLAANYPYLIRAKEAGDKSIVVTDATLMPTEENTIDCSSVFETFTFKGNYSTIELSEDYTLEGGAWNNVSTLNPFRFYLQIESRGTNNTTVKKEAIVLRRVTANGNPTGIEGVESDQNEGVDYIFDLHGRRVTEPQKGGIYIVNGKKILF